MGGGGGIGSGEQRSRSMLLGPYQLIAALAGVLVLVTLFGIRQGCPGGCFLTTAPDNPCSSFATDLKRRHQQQTLSSPQLRRTRSAAADLGEAVPPGVRALRVVRLGGILPPECAGPV